MGAGERVCQTGRGGGDRQGGASGAGDGHTKVVLGEGLQVADVGEDGEVGGAGEAIDGAGDGGGGEVDAAEGGGVGCGGRSRDQGVKGWGVEGQGVKGRGSRGRRSRGQGVWV